MTVFSGSRATVIGMILARLVVPLWVMAGALFKLAERDPRLLPSSVLDVVKWLMVQLDQSANAEAFLNIAMRSMIGAELVAAAIMLCIPKLARVVAIAILSLFCVILVIELQRAGWGASCGCFGADGPPPWLMLLIDGTMLIGLVLLRCDSGQPGRKFAPLAVTAAVLGLAGLGAAFFVPNKVVEQNNSTNNTNGTDPGTNGGNLAVAGFDAPPPPLAALYFPQWGDWVGTRLDEWPLALQIERPLPEDINVGRWYVIFYRGDCDHCNEVLEMHFTGELDSPMLAVRIADTDPADDLPMPCEECILTSLPEGPDYVITPPALLTIVDGTIICVSEEGNGVENCLESR